MAEKNAENVKEIAEKKAPKAISPWDVISYPHLTEKSMNAVDTQNKLVFIVSIKFNKDEIKSAIESQFNVKVSDVKTVITTKGKKKAIATLAPEFSASNIASKLGMM